MKLLKPRYAALAVLCATLAACSGTRTFYRQAPPETSIVGPAQYAKKVLQHHNVIGREIVSLRRDPGISDGAKDALLTAYRKSVCSEEELDRQARTADCRQGISWTADRAIDTYERLRTAETEQQMQEAADDLLRMISELVDLIAGVR